MDYNNKTNVWTSMHKLTEEKIIKVSRGNPYKILDMCTQYLENKEAKELTFDLRDKIKPVLEKMLNQG